MNKRIAEALVECNHALSYEIDKREHLQHNPPIALIRYTADTDYIRVECNPFADTLEGRRQADALEDWLKDNKDEDISWMYCQDSIHEAWLPKKPNRKGIGSHQWRLDRIKWCFEQMEKDNGQT